MNVELFEKVKKKKNKRRQHGTSKCFLKKRSKIKQSYKKISSQIHTLV